MNSKFMGLFNKIHHGILSVTTIGLLTLSLGCAPQPFLLSDHPQYLIVGNGGGFTGQISQYYLLPNDRLYQSNSIHQPPEFIKKMPKYTFDKLVSNILVLDLLDKEVHKPGNRYKMMEYHTTQATYKWVWNQEEEAAGANLVYKNFKSIINE